MSKDIKLTNWQVPRDPKMAGFDALKQSAEANPLDMKNYENMGQVEHHETTESVVEKMIGKAEQARGQKIDQKPQPNAGLNYKGIVDNREKKYWKP